MQRERQGTTRQRAIAALAVGAVVGAVATNLPVLLMGLLYTGEPGGFQSQHIPLLLYMFALAFIVWGVGLVLVGAPIWWFLHKKGLQAWWVAVLLGAVAAAVGNFALNLALTLPIDNASISDSGGQSMIDGELTAYGWWSLLRGAAGIGVVGALVAAVIWRIAYRQFERRA